MDLYTNERIFVDGIDVTDKVLERAQGPGVVDLSSILSELVNE